MDLKCVSDFINLLTNKMRKTKKTFICETCKQSFVNKNYVKNKRFCSLKCRDIWLSQHNKEIGRIPPSHKGKKMSDKQKKNISMSNKLTYSNENLRKWMSIIQKGKKGRKGILSGKSWKGGISYNINEYSKNRRLKKQLELAGREKSNFCELCGAIGKIVYDHDHSTNLFRGWICDRCNLALGLVKDNSELLLKMSEYVKIKQ